MPGYRVREIEHIADSSAQAVPSDDVDCNRCDAVCCRLTVVLQS